MVSGKGEERLKLWVQGFLQSIGIVQIAKAHQIVRML